MKAEAAAPAGHPDQFPETRWTLVLAARADPAKRRSALDALLQPRWRALYALARARGLLPADAEDAVQSFIAHVLEGDLLERLDPGKGRLRSYLRVAFRHFLSNLRQEARAAKRGGGAARESLADVEAWLASPLPSPDALFDRAWAIELFGDALRTLEQEFAQGLRRGPFELLRELFQFGTSRPYPELALEYGMSVSQLKAFVHRARVRFRELLRSRVSETVADVNEVDDELAMLLEALAA